MNIFILPDQLKRRSVYGVAAPAPVLSMWAVLLTLTLLMSAEPVWAQATDAYELGYPGYLVITAARDTTLGFAWQSGPGPGQRSLVWSSGLLSLPDSTELEPFGEVDLAVSCTAQLAGGGGGGRLVFRDGDYQISEPVLLTDGIISFHASAGRLEIRGQRVRYRAPEVPTAGDPRSGYLLLAGVVILIVVLMRRARMLAKR